MKGPTSQTLLFVTGARVAMLGLWFLGNIVLMRHLTPAAFGVYALAVASIKLVTGCVGDALDLSVLREVPLHLKHDRPRALDVLRSSFWLRLTAGCAVLVVVAGLPASVTRTLFGGPEHASIALLVGLGIIADLLARSSLGYLQSSENFGRFIILEFLLQSGRLGAVLVLIATGGLTAITAVSVFAAAPLMVFVVSLVVLPRDVTAVRTPPRRQVGEMVRYAKWMGLSMAMAAVYERVDLFLLGAFRGTGEVGLYTAALALATIPDHFAGCLSTVLQPRIPRSYHDGRFVPFLTRYLVYSAPLVTVGIIGAWLLGGWVIEAFLSAKYAGAALAFKILATGSLLGVTLSPLPNALVAFVAPRRVMVITALGLVLSLGGGLLVIPRFGVTGAAALMVSVRVSIAVIVGCIAYQLALAVRPAIEPLATPIVSPSLGGQTA